MIRIRLQGRMGNQLFQYAFALYASQKLKTGFVFDVRQEDGFQLSYFKLRFPYNLFSYGNFFKRTYNWAQRFVKPAKAFSALNGKEDWSKTTITNNTYYKGYFQDAKFSTTIKPLLQQHFEIKKKYTLPFEKEFGYILQEPFAVLHIRLSDYEYQKLKINNLDLDWALPLEWYYSAIKKVNLVTTKLVIISDDMALAKKFFAAQAETILFPEGNAITHFQFLLHADVCIISNSSYAWWGAFLNKKPYKKIVAPQNWVGYNAGIEFPKGIMHKEFNWV